LIAEIAETLLGKNLQIVVLGTGDAKYHELFRTLAKKYSNKLAVSLKFDNALAHRIEAGSDMFLMPSLYEPCGLNQLYSLKYGTIPIVRTTGGLADTIKPYANGTGTGFRFDAYTGAALLDAIERAMGVYSDRRAWMALMKRAMSEDFSWTNSATQYEELYRLTLKKARRAEVMAVTR
jgi:starch synthase